ncbi:hypothetical protein [Parendozoicomonas haliclonae]|uniref:Alpha/beta hydrolase family protein n=1 Tax=Parendozoicomonas haliclonae TaxID=1960125 RepID=A0A1X7AQ34_9GAMM|nr:hypothetical protein [Parendozoicomonas haliclonae]SMA50253.1 Alpha/beta hydrolase family protein [Parendozoicomonas haliclonae]
MLVHRLPFFAALTVFSLVLAGCTGKQNHSAFIQQKAQSINASAEVIQGGDFQLQTLQIMPGQQKTLRVYIEGDGKAWARRNRPSSDPTPDNPLSLNLMAADPVSDKAYIARPCQYVMSQNCSISIWTDLRYSQQAVDSINQVLDSLKSKGAYEKLELVGFSGGAALALLAAVERRDISAIRTVAGNLDPAYVNRLHNVSFMPAALSPVKNTRELDDVPQLHFFGSEDSVIPPEVYAAYRTWFGKQDCIKGMEVKGADHSDGWLEQWPELLAVAVPQCLSTPPKLQP